MKRTWTFPLFWLSVLCSLPTAVWAQYNPGGDQGDYDRGRDRDRDQGVMYGPGWQVIRAQWGAGNRWADVTYTVRVLLSGNGQVKVNNSNMGGDPAPGADKVLTVIYRSNGREQTATVKEGNRLRIP